MNAHKSAYLNRIRSESAYPTFRTFIDLITGLAIGLGIGICGISIIYGVSSVKDLLGLLLILPFFIGGLIIAALGIIIKQASIMIADIADSITDLNYRYEADTSSEAAKTSASGIVI
jgi:hypothetical protein